MRKYTEITKRKIIEENGEITEKEVKKMYVEKTWQELTEEEKKKEIEAREDDIIRLFRDDVWYNYETELKCGEIDELKEKILDFERINYDGCSYTDWIEGLSNPTYKGNDEIKIYNENVYITDLDIYKSGDNWIIDITTSVDYGYNDKGAQIEKTKKYNNWLEEIKKDITKVLDRIDENFQYYLDAYYNLEGLDEYYDYYFEEEVFTYEIEG